jgi:hypothetical protein
VIIELDDEMDAPCNCPLCDKLVELNDMVPHPKDEVPGGHQGNELICAECAANNRSWRVTVVIRTMQQVEVSAPTEQDAIDAALRQVKDSDEAESVEYLGEEDNA